MGDPESAPNARGRKPSGGPPLRDQKARSVTRAAQWGTRSPAQVPRVGISSPCRGNRRRAESCATSAGLQFQEALTLIFDALYNRDSSLEIIAGMYETPMGNVLNIASDGTIFVQDAVSECVTNGEVRITVTFTNMYFYEYGIDNCVGPDTIWNGSNFSGLAVLDDRFSPEVLEFAVLGEVEGALVSVVARNDRI